MATTQAPQYTGLDDAAIVSSREQYGCNILTPPRKDSAFKKFLKKFNDPLIIILLIAGGLSMGISFYEYISLDKGSNVFFEPLGIFMAIILATGLGFIFEQKADKEFTLLNQVNDDEPVQVIRGGHPQKIAKKDVVVGDIVILSTGETIPADGILLESVSMSVDESSLTGEPICGKTTDEAKFDADATFPSNSVMRGTKVMEGHGVMRVTAVGDHTENGKVFKAAQIDDSVKTPLNEQLDRLGSLIAYVSYAIAIIIVLGKTGIYLFTQPFIWIDFITMLLQTFMVAVALVVVSVPEGLPMSVTLSLAYSMRRMLKTNNLVRKLHACETMGATTVICTDKTGTLTQNQMQVYDAKFFVAETDMRYVYEGMAVNSTADLDTSTEKPQALGNPTEGSLLLWLHSKGIDYETLRQGVTRTEELPFTTERKYMASVVRDREGNRILYVKGAPEIIFAMCRHTGNVTKQEIDAQLLAYQNMAMRTLGFAFQKLGDGEAGISDKHMMADGLVFAGIVAISDPVRSDVPMAVREVAEAGIRVKIVTGDTPGTAREIGRQTGLWNDETDGENAIITGPEFEALSDEELFERIDGLKIIARARPLDKKRLVEMLQKRGEVVAVTGDGTNDAPALKAAHVGLSMGDGTSVAKEASDITIIDNSFSSIGRAVMWGRSLYRNIQRFLLFQMTVNVAACLTVLFGAFMGTESPLTVTQMLWVNLIMDSFAAIALASLPPSKSVMKEKPRDRKDFIINRAMWQSIIGVGIIFFAVLMGILYIFEHYDVTSISKMFSFLPDTGTEGRLTACELSMFFTIFVFLQFWNMFNAKAFATGTSSLHFKGCSGFVMVISLILAGQLLIVTVGGPFFQVTPLSLSDWLWIIGGTSLVLWIGELIRLKKQ